MQKDVIYIDVEDDITAIIGKIKASKEKVVALVPPKRVGVLQSAVNLRLLARTATQQKKHLVLITTNAALLGLASAAKIPVAKNLQSKPELVPSAPATADEDDDVIDGAQMPVGELMRAAGAKESSAVPASAIAGIDIEDDSPKRATPPAAGEKPGKPRAKSGVKVPNFGSFRKKLFIGIAALILLIGFLVWAIAFAPKATVIIGARTEAATVKTPVTLGATLQTDAERAVLKSITQQEKKTSSVEFDATGTKDVGEKAKGTVVFSNCQDSASLTVDSGTYISTGGKNYIVQSTVIVPGGSGNFLTGCTSAGQSPPVTVIATDIGEDYNTAAGAEFTVAGFSNKMTASSSAGLTGGSKRQVKIVTASDVQKALQQLKAQNVEESKMKLEAKFSDDVTVIKDSFVAAEADPVPTPAVGAELTGGKAKLTSEVTYTMTGVAQNELAKFLTAAMQDQFTDKAQQRLFETGAKTAKLTGFKSTPSTTVTLEATGQIGPKIDDAKIKQQVKGKRYGEIQSELKQITGVDDVDTKFSPFWVRTVPNDERKITVEFKLQNEQKD